MIPAEVNRALEPVFGEWIGRLESALPSELRWPAIGEMQRELDALRVSSDDRDTVLATVPEMQEESFEWLLSRLLGVIEASTGDEGIPWIGLPPIAAGLGAAWRSLPIHLFVLGLPYAKGYHRRHGVPAEVTRATMADLGRHVAIHRRMYGSTGVDVPGWMTLHLRGLLYELGRLQYEPARWRLPGAGAETAVPQHAYEAVIAAGGPRPDEPVFSVHIPEAGPLAPDAVEASLRGAEDFFSRSFPEPRRRFAVCHSWLLDDQLAGYLPSQSNIVRFQRRFRLAPAWVDGDRDVLNFVFRRPDADPEHLTDLPQRSRLERSVVAHIREGRHWRVRTGWLALGSSLDGLRDRN